MKASELSVDKRVYHEIFGWVKVIHPFVERIISESEKCLVDIEADEVSYFVAPGDYQTFKRQEDGRNIVFTPINRLHPDQDYEKTPERSLYKLALHPELKFWEKQPE